MSVCKDWGNINKAKILVIGHDPRLQKTDTIAEHCFFADYFFKKDLKKKSEKAKQNLAAKVFGMIAKLTNGKYKEDEIYITNLCNESLPHAPKGKTVYIPCEKASDGVNRIRKIINEGHIEYVFATSLQVNYWLQKLGFYKSDNSFLEDTEPMLDGINNVEPYFSPKKQATFKMICGNIYRDSEDKVNIIPILHPKQYPLNSRMSKHYEDGYNKIKSYF